MNDQAGDGSCLESVPGAAALAIVPCQSNRGGQSQRSHSLGSPSGWWKTFLSFPAAAPGSTRPGIGEEKSGQVRGQVIQWPNLSPSCRGFAVWAWGLGTETGHIPADPGHALTQLVGSVSPQHWLSHLAD